MTTRNIRLLIAFDGSNYCGWQRQQNAPSIQGTLEKCLTRMLGAPATVYGSGRTDAGAHALGMVANFHAPSAIPCLGFLNGLNSMLPRDIRILEVNEAAPEFHSRYSAVAKSYRYDICTGRIQLPTDRLYCAHFPGPVDSSSIRSCLETILGTHDFASFEGSGSRDTSRVNSRGAVRTLLHTDLIPHPQRPGNWSFSFTGDGFLRHMVRNLVGTLMQVGSGKHVPADFRLILEQQDRSAAGPTAPAHGLFLEKVYYDHPGS